MTFASHISGLKIVVENEKYQRYQNGDKELVQPIRYAQFVDGRLQTEDPETIRAIRRSSSFMRGDILCIDDNTVAEAEALREALALVKKGKGVKKVSEEAEIVPPDTED